MSYGFMTVFNPADALPAKNKQSNFGESTNKGTDYTTPTKGFKEKGVIENSVPVEQDADKNVNPLQAGSTTMRTLVDNGKKIDTGFDGDIKIDSVTGLPMANFSQFPGYAGERNINEE